MELEVSNQEHIALADERQVQGQIVVGEHSLALVHWIHFVVHQIFLRQRVVVVQCVAPPSLGVPVGYVVKQVEGVHVIENWRLHLVKDLLVQRVEILTVVNDDLAVGRCHQPFVVGLQVREIERVDRGLDANQRDHFDREGKPIVHEDQDDLSVSRSAQNVVAAWKYLG